MAVTDLSEANGWIPEPSSNVVLQRAGRPSAVEAAGRKVVMSAPTVSIARFESEGVDIVPEHAVIPEQTADLGELTLRAHKWANRFAISVEDRRDAVLDAFVAKRAAWLRDFYREFDNASLGVTATTTNTTTVPFLSVYAAAGAGNRQSTSAGGNISYEMLAEAVGELESGEYGNDLVIIAHPSFQMQLRNLKDSDGNRVVSDPLNGGVPTIFGHGIYLSNGAKTSATATHAPTGNDLLIVASREQLVVGVLDGPESLVSDEARWETDEVELKLRARRAFGLATPDAARVIERVPAA